MPQIRVNFKCTAEGCTRDAVSKQYCDLHYRRFLKYGKPTSIRAPRGSGCLDKYGYVRVPNKNTGGQTHHHRVVMEDFIGRPLTREESVHHKNGIRNDNRIENLELWTKSHPSGQRVEDKISWAIEFLTKYNYIITPRSNKQ